MNRLICSFLLLCFVSGVHAQSVDNQFKRPLKHVLSDIESRFGVQFQYADKLADTLMVDYAQWRFRHDLNETLHQVLTPLNLVFTRDEDGSYRIEPFRYHVRPVEEGRLHLQKLAELASDLPSWERRKEALRSCIFKALDLSPLPEKNSLNPIYTPKEIMNGYTVEQVAIETLPGVFLSGSLYKPAKIKKRHPAVLLAQGHGEAQHYHESSQRLAASLARMGAVVFSYDMFAKGESGLQFAFDDHRTGMAQTMQTWNSIRALDFLYFLPEVDAGKIAMTGASGGGTQTFLLAALDDRIAVSAPVVMVSSWFYGGCPCESGMPVHACGEWGTNNAELAAMVSPKPLLIVSDGGDWTARVPEVEFPYIQQIYGLYGRVDLIENAHFQDEKHDYGPSKRKAVYSFLAKHMGLELTRIQDKRGNVNESGITIQTREQMLVFGKNGEKLPAHAISGIDELKRLLTDKR
ncbi:alpha/beta hydrolase family protein [Gaoshiqia sp. Z1-71]|uniref:alpha/beta hydrolase family protein n=1 Tax=Gaoshiqia hydrogeniformans TaxID=3290090 RepID=UPI003BF8D782